MHVCRKRKGLWQFHWFAKHAFIPPWVIMLSLKRHLVEREGWHYSPCLKHTQSNIVDIILHYLVMGGKQSDTWETISRAIFREAFRYYKAVMKAACVVLNRPKESRKAPWLFSTSAFHNNVSFRLAGYLLFKLKVHYTKIRAPRGLSFFTWTHLVLLPRRSIHTLTSIPDWKSLNTFMHLSYIYCSFDKAKASALINNYYYYY